MLVVTNQNGTQFNVDVVLPGERYGLNGACLHEGREPLVEFYSARGQFIQRYHMSVLLDHPLTASLPLNCGVAAWTVDAPAMRKVKSVLSAFLADAFVQAQKVNHGLN